MNICALLEPSNSGMNGSEAQQVALTEEQLAWAKHIYAGMALHGEADTTNEVPDAQPASMQQNDTIQPPEGITSSETEQGARHGK